jgi:hypothetical protein
MDDQIKAIATLIIEHGGAIVEQLIDYRNDREKQKMLAATVLWMKKELQLEDSAVPSV